MTTDQNSHASDDRLEKIIADLIFCIEYIHDAYVSLGAEPAMRILDANWSRIYALLIDLHDSLAQQHDHGLEPAILSKIDIELAVIEALLGCIRSRATEATLH